MDRQIDKTTIRKNIARKIAIAAGSTAVILLLIIWSIYGIEQTVPRHDLTIGTVDEGPLEATIQAAGRVTPAYEEIIISPVSTRVLKVFSHIGDTVAAGTPLLQLDLSQEETGYDKLVDSRNMKRQELEQLRLTNRTLLNDLEMQIKVKEMEVSRMQIEVENEKRLDSIGSGTGERVRQAETAYHTARLELSQLRTKLTNERSRTASAERVQQLNISTADKDITLAQETLQRGRIPAPISGVLTYVNSTLGAQISSGEKVAVVSDLSQFKITGEIPEESSSRVSVGSEVSVRIGREKIAGNVAYIEPQVQQGAITLGVNLSDPRNPILRPGIRAEIYIACGYKEKVVRLSNGPFFKGPGTYRLFVMDGEDHLVRRQVKLGDSNSDYVEVLSGLRPGDRVPVSDMEKYNNKKKIKLK